jgi:hypothetical protein
MRTFFSVIAGVWLLSMALPAPALAYAGPGAAMGAILVALTVVGAFFLAAFAWLYKPVKALISRVRDKSSARSPAGAADETEGSG